MGDAVRKTTGERVRFGVVTLALQVAFIAVFVAVGDYDFATGPSPKGNPQIKDDNFDTMYPMFQDTHIMIFIGFGFLMTFLKRYGMAAVGVNLIIASLTVQWALLVNGFMHMNDSTTPKCVVAGFQNGTGPWPTKGLKFSLDSMLFADFSAAVILISFGAVLGVASPLQLLVMVMVEVCFASGNEHLGRDDIHAVDAGGSMFVHAFGAYFGLACSYVLYKRAKARGDWKTLIGHCKEASDYKSDIFSMIGTVFLFCFWPSFNAATSDGHELHRAVLNTYLSLITCVMVTAAFSSIVHEEGKLDPVHIQNATLAGGVAVGAMANFVLSPGGAMAVGAVSAIISVIGYKYITPFMAEKMDIHDTCGVHNLHGMPAVLAGVGSVFATLMATEERYAGSLHQVFPAMRPAPTKEMCDAGLTEFGHGLSASEQAGRQAGALLMTLVVSVISGLITGFILNIGILQRVTDEQLFEDFYTWEVEPEIKLAQIEDEDDSSANAMKADYGTEDRRQIEDRISLTP